MDKDGTNGGDFERAQPARGETVGQRGARRGGLAARLGAVMVRRVPTVWEVLRPGKAGERDRVRTYYRTDERYMSPEQLVARARYNKRKRQTHRRRR